MIFKKKKLNGVIWDDEFDDKRHNSIWKNLNTEFQSYNIEIIGFSEESSFKRYLDDNLKVIDFIVLDIVNQIEDDPTAGYRIAQESRANFKKPIFFISREQSKLYNSKFNLRQPFGVFYKDSNYKNIAYSIYSFLSREGITQSKIFIGHGRKDEWRKLKNYIENKFYIECEEFNSFPTQGINTIDRLIEMKLNAGLAFIVMTAEDENIYGEIQARQNVVHEIGLFQGHLGFDKVIIVREEGCALFTNIDGITRLEFNKGDIKSCFTSIEAILHREKFVF